MYTGRYQAFIGDTVIFHSYKERKLYTIPDRKKTCSGPFYHLAMSTFKGHIHIWMSCFEQKIFLYCFSVLQVLIK